jgi:hypothetical protein
MFTPRSLASAALAAALAAADTPVQCAYEPTGGCSAPPWEPRWDMASSSYTYCFGNCPIPWLINNTHLGVWAGVVGVDQ